VGATVGGSLVIPDKGFLRTWCDTLGHVGEAAPEAHLTTGIAVVSALAAPKLRLTWFNNEEFCAVWQLVVGQSALGAKTSTMSNARAAIRDAQPYVPEGYVKFEPLIRTTDAGIVELLAAESKEDADDWGTNWPPSWLLSWNEVATLFSKDAARWEESSRRILLGVYDGFIGSHTRATKRYPSRCCVTMVGNIPPHVLGGAVTETMFSSGFAGRWIVMPSPKLVRAVPRPNMNGGLNWGVIAQEVREIAELVARSSIVPNVYDLMDEGASAVYDAWYLRYFDAHNTAAGDTSTDRAAELWGRARITVVKLAALAAVARLVGTISTLSDVTITAEDVGWAITVMERSLDYFRPLLEETGSTHDPEVEALLRFAKGRAATCEDESITVREFMLKHRSNGRVKFPADRVRRAVGAAAAAGLIDFREQGRSVRYWLVQEAA
jgi:hypothetical protein